MLKLLKNRKLIFISLSSLMILSAIIILIFTFNSNKKSKDPKFVYNSGHYVTDLTPISTSSLSSNYIKMNTLYTNSGSTITRTSTTIDSTKTIAIESAMDFYAFGWLANNSTGFLGYKYELLANIDMNDAYEMDPIGYQNKVFTGNFNGNGHLIKNLHLTPVTQQNSSEFNSTHYYALFCQNSGIVGNFGLIDPIISIGTSPSATETGTGIYYVSNVVGLNTGTVSYVFVRDNLEEDSKETPGIDLLYSTYHVSGLVAVNRGNNAHFSNSYYASSTVISASNTRPAEMQEILLENTGNIENNTLFFYNSLIENYTSSSVRYGGAIDKTFNYNTRYGTYEESIDDLNEAVVGTNSNTSANTWYTGSNYSSIGDLSTFLTSIITPVTRGFKDGQVSYSDNKYYVDINNENDLSYVYELMDTNSKFASNAFIYELDPKDDNGDPVSGINLDNVLSPKYNNGIASTFRTKNGGSSANAKIYLNTLSYKVTTLGIDAYGVFPYLTGKVEYLDFVVGGNSQIEITNNSNNMIAYGAIAGYVEGGEINHCNVYNNIKIDSAAGKYYVGGAVGILAGEGTVSNTTTAGTITATSNSPKTSGYAEVSGYPSGVTVGGAIAYVDSSLGSVDSIYNTTTITATAYSDKEFTVGGVIGSAYFDTAIKLQNNGTLTVNGSYSKLFTSGVVGRLLGISNQISLFTNNGDLTVTQTNSNTYVSGILNADIQTNSTTATTGLSESILKQKSKFYFYASAMTNGAKIVINGTNTSTLMYTNGINIMNSNGFITKLAGVYNLNYRFNATGTSLNAQEIDMNRFNSFAPVILANGNNSDNYIDLETVYNLRDLTFETKSNVTTAITFNYTGCVLGNNINYTDVRNEGNLTINLKNGISNNQTKLIVSGVFNTLDNGFKAAYIYNGGDITINESENSTSAKTFDMYLSGICYQNNSIDNNQQQNPLSTNFDKSLIGTMDSIINAGKIIVSSYYLEKDTDVNSDPSTKPYFNSNIYAGGITYLNTGIITNAFNLGDIDIAVYSLETNKHYDVGGIACQMDGDYAQIRDSANNGDLYVIDVTNKATKTYVNVGGIVSRNTATNTNNKQVIAFTINYGTLNGFQSADNTVATANNYEAHSTVGGILGIGLCNLVNVVDYGNVYGNECVGGLGAVVNLGSFTNSYTPTIANTLIYGTSKINPQYYGSSTGSVFQTYNSIKGLTHIEDTDTYFKNTKAAGVISIFNFNNQNNIKVRYLINFCNSFAVLYNLNNPSTAPDVSTFITIHGSNDTFGGNTTPIMYSPLSTTVDELGNIGVFSQEFILRRIIDNVETRVQYYDPNNNVTDIYIADFYEFVRYDKVNELLLQKIGWASIAYEKAAEDLVKNISALSILVNNARPNSTTILSEAFTGKTWLDNCSIEIINSLIKSSYEDGVLDSSITNLLSYLFETNTVYSSYSRELRTELINLLIEYYNNQDDNDYYELLQSLLYDEVVAKIISGDDVNYEEVRTIINTALLECNNLEEIVETYIKLLEDDSEDNILNVLFENDYKDYYEQPKINIINTLLEGYDDSTIKEIYKHIALTNTNNVDLLYEQYLIENPNDARDIYIHLIANNGDLSNVTSYVTWANKIINKTNLSTIINDNEYTTAQANNQFADITSLTGYKYRPYTWNNSSSQDNVDNNLNLATTNQLKYANESFVAKSITSLKIGNDYITPTKDYSNLWNIIKNDSSIQTYIRTFFNEYTDPTSSNKKSGIIAKATEWNNTYQTNDRPMSDYNLDIDTDGGIHLESGGNSSENWAIINRFIYVPDEVNTYRTNYLGPYKNVEGEVYDQQGWSDTEKTNPITLSETYNYNLGMALDTVQNANRMQRGTVPVMIVSNESLAKSLIANSHTTAGNENLYIFHFNTINTGSGGGGNTQSYMWKHESFLTYKGVNIAPANNATGYLLQNFNTGEYMYDHYNFAPDYVPTKKSENDARTYLYDANGNNIAYSVATGAYNSNTQYYINDKNRYLTASPSKAEYCSTITSNIYYKKSGDKYYIATGAYNSNETYYTYSNKNYSKVNNMNESKYYTNAVSNTYYIASTPLTTQVSLLNQSDYNHTYSDYYFKGYCSAAVITGLWYTYSVWSTFNAPSLHMKDENNPWAYQKYYGIHTTDYACYDMNDLLLLDGIRTKGKSNSTQPIDEDEINIISAIVEKLLSTEEGKKKVLTALYNYSINNNFTTSEANILSYLLSSLSNTDFALESIQHNVPSIKNLRYDDNLTVEERLAYKYVETGSKGRLIADIINSKAKFKEFLIFMLNEQGISKKIADYADYIDNYTRDEFYNIIFDYLNYLYTNNGAITEADVNALFAEVNDSDLSKLVDLIKYNYYSSRLYDELVYNAYYKIYNMMLFTKDDESYDAITYNNVTYDNILRGIDNTSYIELPLEGSIDERIKYNITVIYKGTIKLDNGSDNTSANITSISFNNQSGFNKKLYVRANTDIYDIKVENAAYEKIDSRTYGTTEVTSPWGTISITNKPDNVVKRYMRYPENENGELITDEDVYYATMTSTKYYVLDNGQYSFADRKYDSNKTYYIKSGDTYTAATGNIETDYYNNLRSNTYCEQQTNSGHKDYLYTVGQYSATKKYYTIDHTEWVYEYGKEDLIGGTELQWKMNNERSALIKITINKANLNYNDDLKLSFDIVNPFSASECPIVLGDPNNDDFPVKVKIGKIITNSDLNNVNDVDENDQYSYTETLTNGNKTKTFNVTIPYSDLQTENLNIGIRVTLPCYYADASKLLSGTNITNESNPLTKYYYDANYSKVHNKKLKFQNFKLESKYSFAYTDTNSNTITTNVTFNQDLQTQTNSYFNISTNSNTRSFIEVTGPSNFINNYPRTIVFNQPSNQVLISNKDNEKDGFKTYTDHGSKKISASADYPINGALKLRPFSATITSHSVGDTFSNHLTPNNIKAEPGVNTNFNNGLYDISDIAKYIVRNYFIRHDLTATNGYRYLNLNALSYVEFKATGSGTITVYNANTNAQVGEPIVLDETAQWYEIKLPRGNYKYTTSGSINLEEVVSVYDDYMTDAGIISNTTSGSNNVLTITIDGEEIDDPNNPGNKIISGGETRTLLNIDYSELAKLADNTDTTNDINKVLETIGDTEDTLLSNFNTEFTEEGTTDDYNKYTMFLEVYPYYRSGIIETLRQNDIFATISTLWGTMNWDSTKQEDENPDKYYTIFGNTDNLTSIISDIDNGDSTILTKEVDSTTVDLFDDTLYEQIISALCIADISSISKLYGLIKNDLSSTESKQLYSKLIDLNNSELKKHIIDKIYDIADNDHSSELANYVYAAYLSNDYINHTNYYLSSEMYTLLNSYLEGQYQFIISNREVDPRIVRLLIDHLSSSATIDIDGYGIYALSSSHGKLNGEFIPDNLNLDTMDPGYTITNNIYTLTDADTTDAAWRGGTGSGDAEDDDSDPNSVNYAFYDEMKQLIKSISTTVFELTLTKGNNTYYGDIDLDNHTITYYVTELETGSYTVSKLDLAYRATAYEGTPTTPSGTRFIDGSEEGTTASTITVSTADTVENQFTVFAEDTKVHKTYDIIFKELNTNLTLVYDTTKTTGTTNNKNLTVVSSTDDKKVVLDLTSTNSKLPLGFDLKPYLSFVLMSGTTETDTIYKMDSEYISISSLSSDHKVDISGNSEITLVVSYKLPAGTYRIKVAICNNSDYVTYVKEASHACDITSFKFNGNQLTISNNMTSSIKFGRAYNNIELTNVNGIYSDYDFYLDNIGISPNASITASVEKNLTEKSYRFDANTTVTYNITSYVVTYVVTAEDGTTTHIYTHTLTELDPYNTTVHTYGALFGDGNIINDANTEFNASGNSNQTVVSFERGNETYYRLKYVFTNIYTDNTVVYTKEETTTDVTLKGKATFNIEYHGISADVNEFCDAGTYSFLYKYSRPQVWGITVTDNGDGTYSFSEGTTTQIEYTFPRLVINKTYSTDATLHSIVLIDAYKYQSNASTAMDINVLRPIENPGNDEQYYQDLLIGDTTDNNIKVGNEIDYANNGTNYSTVNYKDYYLVGTVSNAQLANYAPTFGIEKHAMIFQTTTLAKIKNYGKGKQDADEEHILSDKAVLGDHNSADGATIYLYVPFTYINDGETKNKIFLIQLNGKTLTNIYSDRYDGTTNSLGTLNKTLDELRTYKTSEGEIKVTIENVEYTLSKTVGDRIDNPSLYMDYIGNPIDDHFWYVSYVVFSEDYIRNTSRNTYLKFFHTALIDISNNVYFTIKVVTPNDAKFANINEIYITVVGKQYIEAENANEEDSIETIVVGAYVDKRIVDTTNQTITYELIYSIQILPSAYYFFYIDLPAGYEATSMVTDPNKVFDKDTSTDYLNHIDSFPGAYLPPSSLVVQRVPLTITVTEGNEDVSEWAIATSDIFTKNAILILEDED